MTGPFLLGQGSGVDPPESIAPAGSHPTGFQPGWFQPGYCEPDASQRRQDLAAKWRAAAVVGEDEAARQQALDQLNVLDTLPEPCFDALVQAAAALCSMPIGLISLIDRDRQWLKAKVGLEGVDETPRAVSFCTHAIESPDLFVVEDALLDPCFAHNPLVTGEPKIRFYAGAPLRLSSGAAVGTLCVIDRQPNQLDANQREHLRLLASTAVQLLEGRRALEAELALRRQAERISSDMPIGLFATDAAGACTYTNPRWRALFDISLQESMGRGWAVRLHPEDQAEVMAQWAESAAEGLDFKRDFRLLHRDGKVIHVRSQAQPLRQESGSIRGYLGFVQDVSAEVRLHAELQHQATHDALTQLLNRRGFDGLLSRWLQQPAVKGAPGHCLLYIDLDQFKIINDATGHANGDRMLVQVARLLQSFQGPDASLARLGGDEFGLLLPNCSVAAAETMAARLIERFEVCRFEVGEQRFRIGLSIGVVPLDGGGLDPDAVMQAADTCCFIAKEAGRNRWHTWGKADEQLISRNQAMRWVTRLQRALDEGRLELHAQRIVSLQPGASEALRAELLLRIREDDGSLVMPAAFLPPAERFQIATRLDHWVLQKAITHLAELSSLAGIDRICLNVSGQSVGDPSFVQTVDQLLAKAGSEISRRLCFEITETAAIINVAAAMEFIVMVRGRGCTVALDDFGSGMASFAALKSLPVTHLKIDGQFVTGVIDDPLDEVAVRSFVAVAGVIGLRTVAEFVESAAVLERLRQIGVHDAQGFHLHRPEPFELVIAESLAKSDS